MIDKNLRKATAERHGLAEICLSVIVPELRKLVACDD